MNRNYLLKKSAIILFWLCVWQFMAAVMHNNILLVGPIQVGKALIKNIVRPDFLKIIIYSLCRIGLGFFLAFLSGILLGALSYRYTFLETFFAPVMTTLKSIPVASFVVLLLIWFGSAKLSFFISFLIVFPNVYVNAIAGFKSTDKQLLEMAEVFHIGGWNCFFYIYRPALIPYLISCLEISLGMSWKSGVAAEVIGMPQYSLGERLYMSKIYLDTAGLFAWTLLVILLSFLFEKVVLYLVKKFAAWKPYPFSDYQNIRKSAGQLKRKKSQKIERLQKLEGLQEAERVQKESERNVTPKIFIRNVSKSYGKQQVITDFSLTLDTGGHYCLMAPSGGGKTTLLKLINRIEQPDMGTIEGVPENVGMVFQEDRLCETYDVITNIMLTAKRGNKGKDLCRRGGMEISMEKERIISKVKEEALRILPEECLTKTVNELSGGMRRRCVILRAMLSEADILIMDEPFNGLDEENRRRTAAYILEKLGERTLLVATHREEDVELLGGIRVDLAGEAIYGKKC